jgi:hypothetical protein
MQLKIHILLMVRESGGINLKWFKDKIKIEYVEKIFIAE